MKYVIAFTILFATQVSAQSKHSAREVCADDYWKWCAPNEAPFDCFKKRGFFKNNSVLSTECKRAWAKPKKEQVEHEEPVNDEPAQEQPKKLEAQPKKAPASIEPPAQELPVKKQAEAPKSSPQVDDFSDLEFD